jgi:hypothetical protein
MFELPIDMLVPEAVENRIKLLYNDDIMVYVLNLQWHLLVPVLECN